MSSSTSKRHLQEVVMAHKTNRFGDGGGGC